MALRWSADSERNHDSIDIVGISIALLLQSLDPLECKTLEISTTELSFKANQGVQTSVTC